MTTTETKKRIITLTGRPPVRIDEAEWPTIASAWDSDHDGEIEYQANQTERWVLKVRQHADGRALVYGVWEFETNWRDRRNCAIRGGVLLPPGSDLPRAIKAVADDLEGRIEGEGLEYSKGTGVFQRLSQECIASLPVEEI